MYKISIVVPVFNVEETIEKAFNSIKNQSFGFENIEVIFVDDASTDSSGRIIDEFSKNHDNVKSIHLSQNSGYAGKPRNIGIENSTSDYMMFLDPDDEFLEDACLILYNAIMKDGSDIVSGNYIITDGSGRREYDVTNRFKLENNSLKVDKISQEPNLFSIPPSVWCKIVKKEFILKNNIFFPEGIPGQDLVFVFHCFLKADGITYVNKPVIEYLPRISGNKTSISYSKSKKNLLGYLKAYNEIYELFKNEENYFKFIFKHLIFWSEQFVVSNLDDGSKIDLLEYAYPLFKLFKNNKSVNPPGYLKDFFLAMYQKNFVKIFNLTELWALNFKYHVLNIIKDRSIFILISGEEFGNEKEIINQLNNNQDNIKLINLNENLDLLGFELLKLNNYLKLIDSSNDFHLIFENKKELNDYLISKICLSCDEKPFLICFNSYDGIDIKNIDEFIAYKIENLNYKEFCDKNNKISINAWESVLSKAYIEETKRELNRYDEILKLEKENRMLKLKNNEILSSNSWKITEPLRKIKGIKK